MQRLRPHVRVPLLIGVGAAFDFHAGTKRQAPVWMRRAGLEWLFRMLSEPRRLWKRYTINNARFVYYLSRAAVNSALKKATLNRLPGSADRSHLP